MARASAGAPTSQMARALLGLRELLFNGEYPPGQRLSELPLVERLGVSRTPLRLALARLEHEGLIEALATGGYVVRQFTRADVDDAIELRGVLEGTAARLAAERLEDPNQLEAIHGCVAQIDALVRPDRPAIEAFERYVELNERFHTLLLGLARSRALDAAYAGVLALPFASPSAFVLLESELPESHRILYVAHTQHRAMLEAIEHREGARAEALAREHARLARRNLEVVLRSERALERLPGAALIRSNGSH
jgi:GntR family transcriptional regulator, vanillate catabolism transcriptional regulator